VRPLGAAFLSAAMIWTLVERNSGTRANPPLRFALHELRREAAIPSFRALRPRHQRDGYGAMLEWVAPGTADVGSANPSFLGSVRVLRITLYGSAV